MMALLRSTDNRGVEMRHEFWQALRNLYHTTLTMYLTNNLGADNVTDQGRKGTANQL